MQQSVVHAAVVFPETALMGVAQQIRASDMMEVAPFAATDAGQVGLRPIRASLAVAVRLLMINALHFEFRCEARRPHSSLVGLTPTEFAAPPLDGHNQNRLSS